MAAKKKAPAKKATPKPEEKKAGVAVRKEVAVNQPARPKITDADRVEYQKAERNSAFLQILVGLCANNDPNLNSTDVMISTAQVITAEYMKACEKEEF